MKTLLLTLLLILLLLHGAVAQNGNSVPAVEPKMILTGVVYDINGAVIIYDTTVVARDSKGRKYEAATNDEGVYRLELPLGLYRIEVSANGFCPEQAERFRVVNSTHGRMSLDFVLEAAEGRCPRERIEKQPKSETNKSPKPIAG
ncbi:MAG TPA: carboxypeptidase-like regulatory domain-containing protein [Pyrinomonadaceae bacterium]|jgi:hypothetical protein